MIEAAARYRAQAAEMRQFAERARDRVTREDFLRLAAEYEKLAQQAEGSSPP